MKFLYTNTARISYRAILELTRRLQPYADDLRRVVTNQDYTALEASLILPGDAAHAAAVTHLAQQFDRKKLQCIVIIGIGGSNLGTKAVYDALTGFFQPVSVASMPDVIFLDTINPTYLHKLCQYFQTKRYSHEEVLVNMITKSGTTTETIMNLELVNMMLPFIADRLVVTTDKGSRLDTKAQDLSIPTLHIDAQVGGRYSVFSTVGLFPLYMIGYDIAALLEGARSALTIGLQENMSHNDAAISAAILFANYKSGRTINDNFFFNGEFESLGKWYRQLMGESIGKNGTGITPTVSIGSTDLHSVAQLYLGGPKDKITTFVYAQPDEELPLGNELLLDELSEVVKNKKPSQIMNAILQGTQKAYGNARLPYMTLELSEISEYTIGEYMQFKMIEMMYLGKLLGVTTFDQPNVEAYKTETRKLLEHTDS